MTLPIEIRNKLAFRKVMKVAQQTTFSTITAKFWNIHTPTFSPENLDLLQIGITKAFLSKSINVYELIHSIHSSTEQTIFQDESPTLVFMKAVTEGERDAH